MRRLMTLSLAAFMLVLPSAALAQSAGDEQYADPFGQVEEPNSGQDQGAQAPATPAQTTTPTTGVDPAVASQETGATLPRTGLPAVLLAGTGALLLGAGTSLRRRVS